MATKFAVRGKTIAILGLTFKPETDDMRDAPSLTILPALVKQGAKIKAHDPHGMDEARKELPDSIAYTDNIDDAVRDADAIVLMTEWNQFRMLDLARVRTLLREPVVIDLRNVYDPAAMRKAGFRYDSVGRC